MNQIHIGDSSANIGWPQSGQNTNGAGEWDSSQATAQNYNAYYYYPITTTLNTTWPPIKSYAIMELPVKGVMPNKVYVAGLLVSVGIFGSDVDAAFSGKKLIFSSEMIQNLNSVKNKVISLDYGDYMYHYKVIQNLGVIEFEDDSNHMKIKLVSKVKQR